MGTKANSVEFYQSGYITHRKRNIGIVWSGETAYHLMLEMQENPGTHSFNHIRVQQLAKKVKAWVKKGDNRYVGEIIDNKTKFLVRIIVDIYSNFAIIKSGFKI